MVSREDMTDIKSELDERYVLQSDCNDIQEETNKKFANDDKRIELIVHDFGTIKRLMWVMATATVGQLIAMIFDKLIVG